MAEPGERAFKAGQQLALGKDPEQEIEKEVQEQEVAAAQAAPKPTEEPTLEQAPIQPPVKEQFILPEVQATADPNLRTNNQLKAIEKDYLKSITDQQIARDTFLDANARQAVAESEALKLENERIQALRDEQEKQRQDTLKEQELALKNYENAVTEFEKEGELDPKRYYARAGTFEKVLAGISLLFGSAAQATGAKENPGFDIIQKTIERDLEVQKDNIERKKTAVGMKEGILNKMYKKYDNLEVAAKAAELAMLDSSQRKMNQLASQYAAPKIQAQAKEANAQFDQQKAKVRSEFLQASAKMQGGGGPIESYPVGVEISDQDIDRLGPKLQDKVIVLPDGTKTLAINKSKAESYNKFTEEVLPAIDDVDYILNIAQNYNRITDRETRARIKTRLTALAGQLRLPFLGPGAMTEDEYDRLEATIGDPTKLATLPSWEIAKLNEVKNKLNSAIRIRAKQAGAKIQDPKDFRRNP